LRGFFIVAVFNTKFKMATVMKAPERYTHPEWTHSNKTKYKNAEKERQGSERLVEESKRLVSETQDRADRAQADVNMKLEQRLDDIKHWKAELEQKLDDLKVELDALLAFKNRVAQALESTADPLHIAQQCLGNREKRIKIDLVHDDVQKNLIKEVETIQGVQQMLQKTLDQATEQVRLNRKAIYNLEKDLKDKFTAESLDDKCSTMKNHMSNLYLKPGAAKVEANSVTPEEWEDYSDVNINKAEQERMSSKQLRSITDGILQQAANDMNKQKAETDLCFDKRIRETKETKSKLEEHLSRVINQIQEIEENISRLEKAINDKTPNLKVAHTRLDTRKDRPNVELCRDPVQYRLIAEVTELNESVERLKERLVDAETSLKGLIRNQLDLEEDIETKSNTLFVDEVECMGMRKSIHIQAY